MWQDGNVSKQELPHVIHTGRTGKTTPPLDGTSILKSEGATYLRNTKY